jgi:hypothetical protein
VKDGARKQTVEGALNPDQPVVNCGMPNYAPLSPKDDLMEPGRAPIGFDAKSLAASRTRAGMRG